MRGPDGTGSEGRVPSPEDVRRFLVGWLSDRHPGPDRARDLEELPRDRDIFLSGLIDSLGFLELAAALSEYCGLELDFYGLDAEKMTVVGPLCDFVAAQAAERHSASS